MNTARLATQATNSGPALRVRPYAPADAEAWDALVASSVQGTLLHTRRFLSYHGDRFRDASLLVEEADGTLVGVLPAAWAAGDDSIVASHPGVTYGGLVHDRRLFGDLVFDALSLASEYYRSLGAATLQYKPTPYIYHQRPAADDLLALFRLDARRSRCQLSASLDVARRPRVSENRARNLKRAEKLGVVIQQGPELLDLYWPMVEENLASRYGARPVHTLEEIKLLAARFPDEIRCVVGLHEGRLAAGVVLFVTPTVFHAQYIASDERARQTCAIDLVFETCIREAAASGRRYFDFGTSNDPGTGLLNHSLYHFKHSFGPGGVVHEFYDIPVRSGV